MSRVFTIAAGLQNLGALKTGGQGSVYKGKRMGAIYSAIKLMPTPIHTEDETDKNYRNFRNEVTKLQKVNENPCPNVVKIMSWGITDSGSFPYIEMEYIEGPDLSELLQPPNPRAFAIKELVKVADQLANAIAHCHQVGVKHGDIKSNNVKYNVYTGNYVLLDFGLAIMSEEQRRTSIRHAGAVEFMAPEQHEGKMLMQTDIYSYGIILYELLTGQVPFPLNGDGDTGRNSVMLGHMEGQIPDLIKLRKKNLESTLSKEDLNIGLQVPAWLLAVIYKCLEKDPAQRYANGVELAAAITHGIVLSVQQHPEGGIIDNAKLIALLNLTKPLAHEVTKKHAYGNEVRLSKKIIVGLVVAIALLTTFLSYLFLPKEKVMVSYAVANAKAFEPPFLFYNSLYFERILKEREDSIRLEKLKRSEKSNLAKEMKMQDEKKKKRKKFLGIF
ncbi:serine/threonine protein kinase [Pedobacter sp. ok626]|uniref:serine/threonine protein kinase n=1 Tax=Pedobacter sp. ok626 TaxID=1761882 RepID=UPI00087EB5FD|nr:serine/threonine-protein kinase [Pedobacter sp. ok626]SDK13702.1 serine/threonine protein kinase [Pedobacter sp. ok626]